MECPLGMKGATHKDALSLHKYIYGLVQAARQYHKKIKEYLKKLGFTGGDVDPCLFMKKYEKGLVYIALYVDDNLMVGHPEAIDDTIALLRAEGLNLKVEDDLHDYLSCEIKFSEDRKRAWLGQPHLISKLEKKFHDLVKDLREYKTPGTPNLVIERTKDPSEQVSKEKNKIYRSGVGMLNWLVKHSRPDVGNTVCNLS